MTAVELIEQLERLGGKIFFDPNGQLWADIPETLRDTVAPMLKKAKPAIVDELRRRAVPQPASPRKATELLCTLCGGRIQIQKATLAGWYLFWCSCRPQPWFCKKQDWERFAEAQRGKSAFQ